MDVGTLLKLASLFRGLNLADVERLAVEQGVPVAHKFILDHARKVMTAAVPKTLKNLATKAPLDGQERTDLDGVKMTAAQYFLHEADYLLWKAVLKVSKLADGFRDSHIVKMWAAVNPQDGETREALLGRLVECEMDLTF